MSPSSSRIRRSSRHHKGDIGIFGDEVQIVDQVDDLIPQLRVVDETPSLISPFVPFVLDDGVLSLYTPSQSPESSSGPELSASPPPSAAVTPPFSPYEFYGRRHSEPIVEDLFIWQGDFDAPSHIYGQMHDPPPEFDTVSFATFHPSSVRYAPVHAAMSHLSCQLIHMDCPLLQPSKSRSKYLSNNSSIMIASPHDRPLRLITTVYSQGTLISSSRIQMKKHASQNSDHESYSAPLPQDLIDELCEAVDCISDDGSSSLSSIDYLDTVVLMKIVHQEDLHDEEAIIAIVAEFHEARSLLSAGVKISYISHEDNLVEGRHVSDVHDCQKSSATRSGSLSPPRSTGRLTPRLSVTIPSQSIQNVNGIRLSTSPESAAAHRTPPSGIPSSANSPSIYSPTPSEGAYPFTHSSTLSGPAPSPTLGVLGQDSRAPHLGSAPLAWHGAPRHFSPFTPSFFIPHSAVAHTNNTKRKLEANAPLRNDLLSPGDSEQSVLAKVLQWSS